MLGLVEDQITGGARRNNLAVVALRQRQVSARQCVRCQFVHRHVGGRSAAVPVVDLLDLDLESAENRQQ